MPGFEPSIREVLVPHHVVKSKPQVLTTTPHNLNFVLARHGAPLDVRESCDSLLMIMSRKIMVGYEEGAGYSSKVEGLLCSKTDNGPSFVFVCMSKAYSSRYKV